MPQSAEEIYALARSRTAVPSLDFVEWPAFPWVAQDGRIAARELQAPAEADRVCDGEWGSPCWRCEHPDEGVVWGNDRWTLSANREGARSPWSWLAVRAGEHPDCRSVVDGLSAPRISLRAT